MRSIQILIALICFTVFIVPVVVFPTRFDFFNDIKLTVLFFLSALQGIIIATNKNKFSLPHFNKNQKNILMLFLIILIFHIISPYSRVFETELILWITEFILLLVYANLLQERKFLFYFTFMLSLTVFTVTSIGLFQVAYPKQHYILATRDSFASLFGQKNMPAQLVVLSFPLLIVAAYRATSILERFWYPLVIGSSFTYLLFLLCRSAYLSVIFMIIACLLLKIRSKALWGKIIAYLFLSLIIVVFAKSMNTNFSYSDIFNDKTQDFIKDKITNSSLRYTV